MDEIDEAFEDHAAVVDRTRQSLITPLREVADVLEETLRRGNTVLACGNGGSAASAQHFVAELVGRYGEIRRPFRAVALTGDSITLTALANDDGFGSVFSRQVEALSRPGDMVVVLSCSGRSPNVIAAAETARRRECRVIALTGENGELLAAHADIALVVPSTSVARIQEVHDLFLHVLADVVEQRLGTDQPPTSP